LQQHKIPFLRLPVLCFGEGKKMARQQTQQEQRKITFSYNVHDYSSAKKKRAATHQRTKTDVAEKVVVASTVHLHDD